MVRLAHGVLGRGDGSTELTSSSGPGIWNVRPHALQRPRLPAYSLGACMTLPHWHTTSIVIVRPLPGSSWKPLATPNVRRARQLSIPTVAPGQQSGHGRRPAFPCRVMPQIALASIPPRRVGRQEIVEGPPGQLDPAGDRAARRVRCATSTGTARPVRPIHAGSSPGRAPPATAARPNGGGYRPAIVRRRHRGVPQRLGAGVVNSRIRSNPGGPVVPVAHLPPIESETRSTPANPFGLARTV